ncbi:MAG: DNA repair protein RadC [Thermoproteota archaeon]
MEKENNLEGSLAAVLGGGPQGIRKAKALLSHFGVSGCSCLGRIYNAGLPELVRVGLEPEEAVRLKAALELGLNYVTGATTAPVILQSTKDTANFMRWIAVEEQEHFYVLLLDTAGHLLRRVLLYKGTRRYVGVIPAEVFREAVREGAASVIVVHNHPSGDATPSEEDKVMTQNLAKAGEILGIKVLDHVVIGRYGYASICPDTGCVVQWSWEEKYK